MSAVFIKNSPEPVAFQGSAPLSQLIRLSRSQLFSLGKIRLAVYDSFAGKTAFQQDESLKEPLLLIHGFCSMSFTWLDICDVLAEKRRVIAVDLKGFGASDKPDDNDYLMETQAALITELMDVLRIERADVIGHSMGGGIALRMAQLWPKRISRMVVINPAALHFDKFPLIARTVLAVNRHVSQTLAVKVLDRLLKIPGMIEQRMGNAYYLRQAMTAERIAGYQSIARNPETQRAIIATLKRWNLRGIEQNLSEINHRTLIVAGEYDRVIPLHFSRRLAATLPESELCVFPCGHVPHEEMSAEVCSAIQKFLA
jgi:pimeloyl-ACP methyl ester carboxylesterase